MTQGGDGWCAPRCRRGRNRAVDRAHERDRRVDTGGGVVITQTGVPLQRLQERVEQDGFMFPLDLGARGSCTIGGNISTNAGGNLVIRYGMTRDLVLGLEAVLADGTILKGVRKYIKNNTGIDLKQLFVGTEGTLGVVTRAALRIFPAPAEQQVALCALSSFDKVRALLALSRSRLGGDLTAFEVMWNNYYRLTTELVKGVAAPLATNHPFYVLLRSSGSDAVSAPTSKTCSTRRWRTKSSSMPRLRAPGRRPRRSGGFAIPRSSSAARSAPASASTSALPSTGWRRSRTPSTRD
jgi:FAD/FMN-containing dehydrogenase